LTCEFCFLVSQPSTLSAPAFFFFFLDEPNVTVACSSLRLDDVSVRGKVVCKAHDAHGSNHRKPFHSSPQPHALQSAAQSTCAHVLSSTTQGKNSSSSSSPRTSTDSTCRRQQSSLRSRKDRVPQRCFFKIFRLDLTPLSSVHPVLQSPSLCSRYASLLHEIFIAHLD